jgi:hypothetical protein
MCRNANVSISEAAPDLETALARVAETGGSTSASSRWISQWIPDPISGLMPAPRYVKGAFRRIIGRLRQTAGITEKALSVGTVHYHKSLPGGLRISYFCSPIITVWHPVESHHETLSLSGEEQKVELRRESRMTLLPYASRLAWTYEVERTMELRLPQGATARQKATNKNAGLSQAECDAVEALFGRVCDALEEREATVGAGH